MNINLFTSLAPIIALYLAQFVKNPASAKAQQLRSAVSVVHEATGAFLSAVPEASKK